MQVAPTAGEDAARPLRAFFAALAEHLSENVVLRQRYCEHVPPDLLFDRLARPLTCQVVDRGLVGGDVSDEDLELMLAYGLGGLFSLYRWWLLSDRALPLEELTRRACRLVEGGLAPFLDR